MPRYDVEYLRTVLYYDLKTGNFYWPFGDIAGTIRSDGYVQIWNDGQAYRAHILAWLFQTGELPPKGKEIDHKNRNRADNSWDNLRLVTRTGNNLNRDVGKSGARGVYKTGNCWFARITIEGKIIHLGTYDNFDEAVAVRKEAEAKYWRDEEVSPILIPKEQYREKQSQAARKVWSDPQLRADQSARLKTHLSDPEAYNNRLEQIATIRQLGHDAANKVIAGSIWITDGKVNRRFRPDQGLPEGFSIGRTNLGNLGRKPRVRNRVLL